MAHTPAMMDLVGREKNWRALQRIFTLWNIPPLTRYKYFFGAAGESGGKYQEWERAGALPENNDVLRLASYYLGIYKNLETIFPEKEHADGWMESKNDFFDGYRALEYILIHCEYGLERVHEHVLSKAKTDK